MRILLVEDNLLIAMMYEDWLRQHGHDVVGIARGLDEALALARTHRPEFAFVDFALLDGETGGKIVETLRTENICPSVFLTGNAERAEAFRDSAQGILVKPVEPKDLTATLDALSGAHNVPPPEAFQSYAD